MLLHCRKQISPLVRISLSRDKAGSHAPLVLDNLSLLLANLIENRVRSVFFTSQVSSTTDSTGRFWSGSTVTWARIVTQIVRQRPPTLVLIYKNDLVWAMRIAVRQANAESILGWFLCRCRRNRRCLRHERQYYPLSKELPSEMWSGVMIHDFWPNLAPVPVWPHQTSGFAWSTISSYSPLTLAGSVVHWPRSGLIACFTSEPTRLPRW